MKAKTMLGLIACASACVSLSAFGNETNGWFGVKVENAEIVHHNCATNGAAVTIDGSAIKLEDASLGIDSFAAAPTSDGIVKISATALLTPSVVRPRQALRLVSMVRMRPTSMDTQVILGTS